MPARPDEVPARPDEVPARPDEVPTGAREGLALCPGTGKVFAAVLRTFVHGPQGRLPAVVAPLAAHHRRRPLLGGVACRFLHPYVKSGLISSSVGLHGPLLHLGTVDSRTSA